MKCKYRFTTYEMLEKTAKDIRVDEQKRIAAMLNSAWNVYKRKEAR